MAYFNETPNYSVCQMRVKVSITKNHVSLLDSTGTPVTTLFMGKKLVNQSLVNPQHLLVFSMNQFGIGQLELAKSKCVQHIHLKFNADNREQYSESIESLGLSHTLPITAVQNFFKPTIIVTSCHIFGSSVVSLFSLACILAVVHNQLFLRKLVPWDIEDSGAFVQLVPSVSRMSCLSGNWAESYMTKTQTNSTIVAPVEKDLSTLFESSAIHGEDSQSLEIVLSSILKVVSQVEKERRYLIRDKEKLVLLSKLFIHHVEDVDISLRIIQIFVELCEHDAQDAREGVQNLGICFQAAGTRSYLVQCTRSALISGRGELFGKICRLRQLFSLWRSIRCVDSPEMMAVFVKMIGLIVQGLQKFISEPKVIVDMCGALATFLACHDDCKKTFIDLKGAPLVVSVLKTNLQEEHVCNQGCQILNITADSEFADAAEVFHEKSGTHTVVLTCLARFVKCVPLIEAACSLLIKMINKYQGSTKLLVKLDALKVVQNVLSLHEGNALVEPLANKLVILLSINAEPDESNSSTHADDVRARTRSRANNPGQVRSRAERSRTAGHVRMSRRSRQENQDVPRPRSSTRRTRHDEK